MAVVSISLSIFIREPKPVHLFLSRGNVLAYQYSSENQNHIRNKAPVRKVLAYQYSSENQNISQVR